MNESQTQLEEDLTSYDVAEVSSRESTKYVETIITVYDDEGNIIYYSTMDKTSNILNYNHFNSKENK